jgi:hypothetical protein
MQTTLNVQFLSLGHVFADNLCQALPRNNVVPLSSFLPFTGLVFESLVCGYAELSDRDAAWCVLHVGVFSDITNQNHFVNAFSHNYSSLWWSNLEVPVAPSFCNASGLKAFREVRW